MIIKRECKNCAFWNAPIAQEDGVVIFFDRGTEMPIAGWCAKNPPAGRDFVYRWPITKPYEWCGQFTVSKEALDSVIQTEKE